MPTVLEINCSKIRQLKPVQFPPESNGAIASLITYQWASLLGKGTSLGLPAWERNNFRPPYSGSGSECSASLIACQAIKNI